MKMRDQVMVKHGVEVSLQQSEDGRECIVIDRKTPGKALWKKQLVARYQHMAGGVLFRKHVFRRSRVTSRAFNVVLRWVVFDGGEDDA